MGNGGGGGGCSDRVVDGIIYLGNVLKRPVPVKGSRKYGPVGLFSAATFEDMGLPGDIARALTVAGNNSLAKSTWSVYKTAKGHMDRCEADTGMSMSMPLGHTQVVAFVGWLLVRRGVRGATVESYLSGLRKVHLAQGYDVPCLRPELVKSVIAGAKNMSAIKDRAMERPRRLPVTLDLLKLLKIELNDLDEDIYFKRLIWAVACLLFFGAFRVHEVLSTEHDTFDPDFTLLHEDVTLCSVLEGGIQYQTVQVMLKSPKENRVGNKVIVDVYANGGECCPYRALQKWWQLGRLSRRGEPAFLLGSGKALTGALFNRVLRRCWGNSVPQVAGSLTSHSFRTGLASMMGNLGFGDQDIQAMGRWSSSAFETYLRLPRTRRAEMARRMAGMVARR